MQNAPLVQGPFARGERVEPLVRKLGMVGLQTFEFSCEVRVLLAQPGGASGFAGRQLFRDGVDLGR